MTNPPQNPVAGILWMIATGLLLLGVTVMVKTLGTRLPAAQVGFLRYGMGVLLLLPALKSTLASSMTPRLWRLLSLRGAVHALGVIMWFYAMARIPIADVTALNYTSPVFVTIGAALFLGERIAARRIIAVIVGLLGALVILRPGFRELDPGHIAMIFGPLGLGASYIIAKKISGELSAAAIVAMLSLTVAIALLPLALIVWVPPTWGELGLLAVIAVFATLGHYSMSRAFQVAPVSVTQPVTFLQLIWAVLVGWLFFNEGVDPYVVLGGAIIVGAVSFISWREATLKRRQVTPVVHETK